MDIAIGPDHEGGTDVAGVVISLAEGIKEFSRFVLGLDARHVTDELALLDLEQDLGRAGLREHGVLAGACFVGTSHPTSLFGVVPRGPGRGGYAGTELCRQGIVSVRKRRDVAAEFRRVGLTGGIGSGKSTVAKLLQEHGAVVIDADAISRELTAKGSPVLDQIRDAFGTHVLTDTGELDRAALAKIVFDDETARERLNSIVHPAVRQESARLVDEAARAETFSGVVVQDIPLLVETGQADSFDGVIVVEAPESVRIDRLVTARGMKEDDARSRIRSQATDDQRRAVATWIIDNSGDRETTTAQVATLWDELTA